jgi:hypothetical protein
MSALDSEAISFHVVPRNETIKVHKTKILPDENWSLALKKEYG